MRIVDRAVIEQILALISADFLCHDSENKIGAEIEKNLSEEGIRINFSDWLMVFDAWKG